MRASNLVPHCPTAHRRVAVSGNASPNEKSSSNTTGSFGLSPLIINTAVDDTHKSEMTVIADNHYNSSSTTTATATACKANLARRLLPKKSSFLLKNSFSVSKPGQNGTDMIVKIISEARTTAATIHTPRNVMKSPSTRKQVPPLLLITSQQSNEDSSLFVTRSANDVPKTGTNLRLLLVEDSVSISKMTSMLLKRQGYTVDLANNGAVALELITQDPAAFDIILMDLQMPVMDGLEATRRIRLLESQQTPLLFRQRIICLSANNDVDTLSAAFEAGLDAYMEKPIEMAIFQSTATELMNFTA